MSIEIVHVVAMDLKHCIGKDNQLPWHLPADLKHFKQLTQGGHVIMGRKTFESIGRALPNRTHWVITRNPNWQADGVHVVNSLDQAIENAKAATTQQQIFIIGGGDIFKQSITQADRLEITHVGLNVVDGDAFYPEIPANFYQAAKQEMHDDKLNIDFQFASYLTK